MRRTSRFHTMGAQTLVLKLSPPSPAAAAAAQAPAAPAQPTTTPGFWESASTGEKVAIVGAGAGALLLLFLAMKK